jgi:predicted DNA-binding protein
MPSRKRIALSVPPEMDEVLERLAALTNQPKTKLILEMLEEYVPVLEQAINALEQIQANKENASNIVKQFASEMLLDGNQKLGQIASEVKNLK